MCLTFKAPYYRKHFPCYTFTQFPVLVDSSTLVVYVSGGNVWASVAKVQRYVAFFVGGVWYLQKKKKELCKIWVSANSDDKI